MITVTMVFDDKEGDEHHTPGVLSIKTEDATPQEMACLIADGVEIFAKAMEGVVERFADNPAVAMLVLSRMDKEDRFSVREADSDDKGFGFKPFFDE